MCTYVQHSLVLKMGDHVFISFFYKKKLKQVQVALLSKLSLDLNALQLVSQWKITLSEVNFCNICLLLFVSLWQTGTLVCQEKHTKPS